MVSTAAGLWRQPMATVSPSSKESDYLDDIEGRIIQSLSGKPRSSISEVARELSVNRSTASKYLYVLKAKKKVDFQQVGPVKLWSLEDS
jgi:predicted transcriptional regulator